MRLKYETGSSAYVLYVDRASSDIDIRALVMEHGFDYSSADSTGARAVLFTRDAAAAVTFFAYATPETQARLSALKAAIDASWAKESGRHVRVPADKELWPFQRAGVDYAINRQHALVGDQPGLGKTPTAIALANEMQAKRVLVVCPANIRLQWARMIREWSTMDEKYLTYPILKGKDGSSAHAPWTIVSYDLLRNPGIHAGLRKNHYDLLILDEAHYLKTVDAARTRALFGGGGLEALAKSAERVLALTGTPLPNRPREAYTLARHLDWGSIDWASEEKFKERFNPSRFIERRDPTTGEIQARYTKEKVGRLPELQNRLRSSFMVRRLKRDVLTQLPQVRYEIVHAEETGAVTRALAAERMLDIDPEDLEGVDAEILGHVSVVRRQMGIALAPQVADYVDMILDGGEEKIFLVGWHIEVLNILEERLSKHGLVRVDGSVSPRNRQLRVDRFISDPTIRIFLGNVLAVGIGVDGLQRVCSHMVGAECDWTPGNNEQVVDRLNRMGQEGGVLAEWMVAPGSFGERIIGSAIRKLKNIDMALDRQYV